MSLLTALFTVIFAAQAKTTTVCQLSGRRTYKDFILTEFSSTFGPLRLN